MIGEGQSLLSVDIEDWFQVENLRQAVSRGSWGDRELRVEKNVDRILNILARHSTHATFFVLGWIAEHSPDLVKRIHASGHEVASHGYGHELVYNLPREHFREDLQRSRRVLEDLTGQEILGYRAPSFSITDWAIDELYENGFRYDSSLFPTVAHDRYGKLKQHNVQAGTCVEVRPGFYEVLLSCLPILGMNVPWAGGGYFRIIPYSVFRQGIERILKTRRHYCFYVHPWEFDPGQPRIGGIKAIYKFRHYVNLGKTEGRFERLLEEFSFQPIRKILPEWKEEHR